MYAHAYNNYCSNDPVTKASALFQRGLVMGLNVRDQPLAPLLSKGLHGSGHADAVKAHAPEGHTAPLKPL